MTITQREAEIMDLADSVSQQAYLIARMVHDHIHTVHIVDATRRLVGDVDVLSRWIETA